MYVVSYSCIYAVGCVVEESSESRGLKVVLGLEGGGV